MQRNTFGSVKPIRWLALIAGLTAQVLAIPAHLEAAEPWNEVRLTKSGDSATLENGYIQVVLSSKSPSLTEIGGCFTGVGNYKSILSDERKDSKTRGFVTEVHISENNVQRSNHERAQPLKIMELTALKDHITISLNSVSDAAHADAHVKETWALEMRAGQRFFTLDIQGEAQKDAQIMAVRHSLYADPTSGFGLFDKGIMQMLDQERTVPLFPTTSKLYTWYSIGLGKSAQVVVEDQSNVKSYAMEVSDCCDPNYKTGNVPIEQAYLTDEGRRAPYHSALHTYMFGNHKSPDKWGAISMDTISLKKGDKYHVRYQIAANDNDFPVLKALPDDARAPNLPLPDLKGFLTGIWSSPVGVMRTFDYKGLGTPTIWRPEPSYEGNYNFFDPDCYMTVTALMFSGVEYLHNHVRDMLEKTVEFVREDGLMPHHLTVDKASGIVKPIYTAISGAVQSGPNIFWTLSCLEYARGTGDVAWLKKQLSHIDSLVSFLLKSIDKDKGLIDATGPLMIDVFKREHFATDTNAGAVFLFNQLRSVYLAFELPHKAKNLEDAIEKIKKGMNAHLWSEDHYVTSLSPSYVVQSTSTVENSGEIVDMVDYDANLIAVAAGVADTDRANAILARIDRGPCAHGRATWVSEKEYDLAHVYSGPMALGDSKVTMARIGWFDAHSRRRLKQQPMFHCTLLNPIRDDLLEFLWLNERYNCQGVRSRGYGFMFYPAMVSMMTREIRYGVHLGLREVRIEPFGPLAYNYDIGGVRLAYSQERVALKAPGAGPRTFTMANMLRGREYLVSSTGSGSKCGTQKTIKADDSGELVYEGFLECEQSVQVQGTVKESERAKTNALNWLTCFDAPKNGQAHQSDGDREPDQDTMVWPLTADGKWMTENFVTNIPQKRPAQGNIEVKADKFAVPDDLKEEVVEKQEPQKVFDRFDDGDDEDREEEIVHNPVTDTKPDIDKKKPDVDINAQEEQWEDDQDQDADADVQEQFFDDGDNEVHSYREATGISTTPRKRSRFTRNQKLLVFGSALLAIAIYRRQLIRAITSLQETLVRKPYKESIV